MGEGAGSIPAAHLRYCPFLFLFIRSVGSRLYISLSLSPSLNRSLHISMTPCGAGWSLQIGWHSGDKLTTHKLWTLLVKNRFRLDVVCFVLVFVKVS